MPTDLRWRRVLAIGLFLALLYMFRSLAPVFICFIIFERTLGFIAEFIDRVTPLERKGATIVTLLGFFVLVGLGGYLGVAQLIPVLKTAREDSASYADYLANNPTFDTIKSYIGDGGEDFTATIKEHALEALHYVTETAHVAIYLAIGVLLAVMYLLEKPELDEWFEHLEPSSIAGTMCRWFGYVGDAIAVTVRLQAIVALFDAIVTLPLLIVLGLPHPLTLFSLLLILGLLPVVGGVISGLILCVVAYTAKGPWAVGIFLGVTFFLAKIESYVLTPRLASQHVALPSLMLVVSLLLFEEAFGFVGLFLSFPALYIASRIKNEWRSEPEKNAERQARGEAASEALIQRNELPEPPPETPPETHPADAPLAGDLTPSSQNRDASELTP